MPRYYFDLTDGGRETDDEGVELAGIDEARREAVIFLGATIRDDPGMIWDGQDLRVEVRDGGKEVILAVIAHLVDGHAPGAGAPA